MRLHDLMQAYEFDEIMPVIVDMFPGTGKFSKQLQLAWDLLLDMRPVTSKKVIRYKIIDGSKADEKYIGADDNDFMAPWQNIIGKDVARERGVDLNDAELLANCLVNICLLGRHPKAFDEAYRILSTPDR